VLLSWLAFPDEAPGGDGSHNYICQIPDVATFVTENPVLWFQNHESLVLRTKENVPNDTIFVRDLTRGTGNQPWTGEELVAPSTITTPVNIAEVEY
jgi:hypothetical protein